MTYTLATICARGGSKGLPGKNIALLAGHPLIAYSVSIAKECPFIDRTIVSTDSGEIAAVARRYGADIPFVRPGDLASDTAAKVEVIQHAVREVERQMSRRIDIVVDLDVTAPLRTVDDIRACWDLVQTPLTDVVFTVTVADRNPYFNMVEMQDGYAHVSKTPTRRVVRRQDAPAVYAMNASVYAYNRDYLLTDGAPVAARSRAVGMPALRSRDIDGPVDLEFVDHLVRRGLVELPDVSRSLDKKR